MSQHSGNFLGFKHTPIQKIFNVRTFLLQFKGDQFPSKLKKIIKNIKNANFRNKCLYIPRVKSIKIGLLPPHNFPTVWYENKTLF